MRYLLLALIVIVTTSTVFPQKNDFYSKHWSNVYKHELRELPKSAQAVVDSIYVRAKKEKNTQELIKALIYQSKFAVHLQENAEISIVKKFKEEISQSKGPLKNLLESVLANIYWEYLKQNRYKYYGRSRTSTVVNQQDFTTWDANAMFNEIHQRFQNSLKNRNSLQNIQLEFINEILIQADDSKKYRPTLYDFLVHNALDFYSTNESTIIKPSNEFRIDNDKYFFDFEELTIESADSLSPLRQTLLLYQDLLAFHKQRRDTNAYVNLEIQRLAFVAGQNHLDNSSALQKEALTRLRNNFLSHPASTLVAFELAALLNKDGNDFNANKNSDHQFKKAEAIDLCNQAIAAFPNSDGAEKCVALRELILHQQLSITAEKYIPVNTPAFISIRYANVDSLHFTVCRITKELEGRLMGGGLTFSQISALPTEKKWSVQLKNVNDYQLHSTEVVLPGLTVGRYVLLATTKNLNEYDEQIFGYATLQVTNLSLLEFSSNDQHHYQVLDRNSGKPLEGANIHLERFNTNYGTAIDEFLTTGKHGVAILKQRPHLYAYAEATVRYGGDEATFGDYYINALYEKTREEEVYTARSFLFTDRSIYRPGQMVFFKGILIQTKNGKSSIVPGEYVTVYLDDANANEVGSLRLKTNTYGSFSGEFKLPASGLTGEYALYAEEDDEEDSKFYDNLEDFYYDELTISVEEYKRPTFEATFKPVKGTFILNDTVVIKGTAEAFSGAKLSKAQVKYKVTRKVRYPRWYYWSFREDHSSAAEISHGETLTDEQGEFTIAFKSIPDDKASPKDKPVFIYEITADVTDISGETRSATAEVKVGYHAITATITAPARVDLSKPENAITLTTENLNGQFVGVSGKVEIFKLKEPDAPVRARPWEAPDLPMLTEAEFRELFPHDTYSTTTEPKHWPRQKLMVEIPFNTRMSREIKYRIGANWPAGNYVMELTALDSLGQTVKDLYHFTVTNAKSKAVADNALLVFELDKPSYKVGEVAKLKVGSASPDVTFFIHIERDHKITKTYTEKLSASTTVISIPITEEQENGFSVSCRGVMYNSFVYKTINIPVISPSKAFEIETITFKDKLQPGAKETWSFSIKGDDAGTQQAEVLASMYDASLDQFKPHQWQFEPVVEEPYFATVIINGNQSFGEAHFTIRNLAGQQPLGRFQYYDKLDWFGFTLTRSSYVQRAYLNRLYSTGAAADTPSKVIMRNNKNAKDGFIYGQIIDNDGQPMPGVNIIIKGTTIGTTTDMEGNYVIEADKDDVLIYSFIGYASAETHVGRKNTIDVIMEPDITELSEVVVTGYGVQTKKMALGASVHYVVADSSDSDVEFDQALAGRVAGVQIKSDGVNYLLRIRGASSLSGAATPLYVVDGVIVESSLIDQTDLADVQLLKGDAAVSLYGAKAANGAIIITTKSGQKKLDEALAKVNARKNFNETAFFFPHLSTNADGDIRFTFTTPESLTRWKLQLLAHTKNLLTTTKTLQTVTQKQLMITPNVPRFVRTGDQVMFTVKITNLSAKILDGKIGLQLTNAVTGTNVDAVFGNAIRNKTFRINARENTSVSWTLKVPEGVDALQYKVVAKAGAFSDGEQNALPILSNRMLVTETMPLFVRSSQTKTFTLEKLRDSKSTTLKHHQLTLEVTSNPAWYAVQSLPYLMEFPHECAEQMFSRYYANAMATHIIKANPVISPVFEKWSSLGELESNLDKNPELKSIIIEDTPWLRDARGEAEQKKRLSLLFDLNTMRDQLTSVLNKVEQMQFPDGGFPWFAGSRYPNRYITQHIACTYGHLKKLQVADYANEKEMMTKAVRYLDHEFLKNYGLLLKNAAQANPGVNDQDKKRTSNEYLSKHQPSDHDVHYLYMRSFYNDIPAEGQLKEAIDYYQKQTAKFWQDYNLYVKGMIALVHHRDGTIAVAKAILASLRETAITSDELGMYWKENTGGMYWNQADIETQSLLIEAFAEIEQNDSTNTTTQKTIDELRLWLLKNKQTTQWKTTKATTEAIYALLMNGTNWLTLDDAVDVTVGKQHVLADVKQNPEVATGYFKTSWQGETITPDMATVTFTKKGEGVAWGGLYWQYFEDLDKITPAETPLKLTKKIFVVTNTDRGELLTDITTVALKGGDLLRVRIELSSDRAMEFVHMKDMRAAGLEPVDVLSEYKWQENLGYYQSTRDAATHFFFDYLPKGTYVFEYDLRVNVKGNFSNGITSIQNMYAPEFGSHSEGVRIEVK
ncbi:carboxypeptidase-like regulatory domain-containing protein [Chryseolinea sp. H1M3-3]|uniref:alpha-2-macroglobulin family protein n=1 Tax=Chryseolinea sp. H1M3-3 TaxID=3034144 RepID=UPI0023EC5715|nr:carboxypeptidase-like regulatory domain-containing protein [Chryseolinea sp. H1M3-3]